MEAAPFEGDTPAFERARARHDAENRWLVREFGALLGASRSYAKSLAPTSGGGWVGDASEGVGLGGMLAGALQAGVERLAVGDRNGANGGDGVGRVGAFGGASSADAAFANALERVGTVAASTTADEEMAGPMAAAVGAQLLSPVADALREIGTLRNSLGRRVDECLVGRIRRFVDDDLAAVATAKEKFERARRDCDAARAHFLRVGGKDANDALDSAREALEASRARLALAHTHAEGVRRYVLLEATRETMTALRRFFDDAASVVGERLRDSMAASEEYETASRARAEMNMVGAASAAASALASRGGVSEEEEEEEDDGDKVLAAAAAAAAASSTMNTGRSADVSIRKQLAEGTHRDGGGASGRRALGVGVIRRGYLAHKRDGPRWAGGGWSRRYFVLDGAGRLVVREERGRREREREREQQQKKQRGGSASAPGADDQTAAAAASPAAEPDAASPAAAPPTVPVVDLSDDEVAAATAAAAAATAMNQPPRARKRDMIAPMAASAMRGIGSGLGAAWKFVATNAAPEPGAVDAEEDYKDAVDLRTSCVKPGPDPNDRASSNRPFCFRVISPAVSLSLQAESEEEMRGWIADLQGVIAELISLGPGPFPRHARSGSAVGDVGASDGGGGGARVPENDARTRGEDPRETLASIPGNSRCADCGAADPDWASLNLCVVVCHDCAGVHRHLGAHVSKVRSLALDADAWTPPVMALFERVGNERANAIWCKRRPDANADPVASNCATREEALAAISNKYVARAFVDAATADPGAMEAAAAALDCAEVLARLAAGADADAKRLALRAAARRGEDAAPVIALLLSNGAAVAGEDDANVSVDATEQGSSARTLAIVRVAMEAGCGLDGVVVGLLRAAAEARGARFQVSPAAVAAAAAAAAAAKRVSSGS